MMILSWVYNTPELPEYHGEFFSLTFHTPSIAHEAYNKRKNDPRYVELTLMQYWGGEYTKILPKED